jgi:hypothetical protein
MALEAGLLRETTLAEWADQHGVLVLLLHVSIKGGLCGEHLVTVLAGEALANVVMEPLNVCKEVVLLEEQLVADKALEGLPVV